MRMKSARTRARKWVLLLTKSRQFSINYVNQNTRQHFNGTQVNKIKPNNCKLDPLVGNLIAAVPWLLSMVCSNRRRRSVAPWWPEHFVWWGVRKCAWICVASFHLFVYFYPFHSFIHHTYTFIHLRTFDYLFVCTVCVRGLVLYHVSFDQSIKDAFIQFRKFHYYSFGGIASPKHPISYNLILNSFLLFRYLFGHQHKI